MSLITNLKMRAKVERQKTLTKDQYGFIEPNYDLLVYTSEPCFIHVPNAEYRYGKTDIVSEAGLRIQNIFSAFFRPGRDIKANDKITCLTFTPSVLYVASVAPVVSSLTGIVSHLECVLYINPV